MLRKLFPLLIGLLTIALTTYSQSVINVPSDYSTIQAALDNAIEGDTVLVQPGTYYENIIWPATNSIKLISAGDSSNTIIDGADASSVIYLNTTGSIGISKIEGFKICNGGGSNDRGGGIYITGDVDIILNYLSITHNNSGGIYYSGTNKLTINNCTISYNNGGCGGIYAFSIDMPSLSINNSIIKYNTSSSGGMHSQYIMLLVDSCEFIGNVSTAIDAQGGGGIYIYGKQGVSSTIKNSKFKNNKSTYGGGISTCSPNTLQLENVDFLNNEQTYGTLYLWAGSYGNFILKDVTFYQNLSQYGGGIYFNSNYDVNISFDNVNIHSNEATYGAGIYVRSTNYPFTIENTSFSQNSGESIISFIEGYDRNHKINNVTMANNFNKSYAISLTGSSVISSMNFVNNGLAVNNILTPNYISAINNYWGHTSGPYHPNQNVNGLGDSVGAFVNIDPWLTKPDTGAPPNTCSKS
jgi:hypothetical protein